MNQIPKHKKIILFDGVCNLCHSAILTIIKYDKKHVFLFANLQSATGKKILKHLNIDVTKLDSILLYEPNIAYEVKSTAVLNIAKELSGFWKICQVFLILPKSFRDVVYDFVARNRYQWFGKKQVCELPTSSLLEKFM